MNPQCLHHPGEIFFEVINGRWRHVEQPDHNRPGPECEPWPAAETIEVQPDVVRVATPDPVAGPGLSGPTGPAEAVLIEADAWKQAFDLNKRFTQTWEVRSDLEVTALGTKRNVRLRVGDWSFNAMKQDPRDYTAEPQITDRNVSTMRELANAILAACDFVDQANPKWAGNPVPPVSEWKITHKDSG